VVAWRDVPGPVRPRAGPHSGDAATIRADISVRIKTPDVCLPVDGSITYYLWPVWDGPRVQLQPDGWDTHTDLLSACQDKANNEMKKQVSKKETIDGIRQLVENFVFQTWTPKQRWISTTHGTLGIDRELPGVLPPVGPNCPPPKPPPQCPPPRPVNKPPVECELKDKNDGCGTKVCVCVQTTRRLKLRNPIRGARMILEKRTWILSYYSSSFRSWLAKLLHIVRPH